MFCPATPESMYMFVRVKWWRRNAPFIKIYLQLLSISKWWNDNTNSSAIVRLLELGYLRVRWTLWGWGTLNQIVVFVINDLVYDIHRIWCDLVGKPGLTEAILVAYSSRFPLFQRKKRMNSSFERRHFMLKWSFFNLPP